MSTTTPEIQEALLELTKCKVKPGESAEDFTQRVVDKVNALADKSVDHWEALGATAQEWVNDYVTAHDVGQEPELLVLPEDADTAEPAAAPEESAMNGEVVASAKRVKPAKTKENARAAKTKAKAPTAKAVVSKPKAGAKGSAKSAPGRRGSFDLDAKVKILAKENPHRKGTLDFKKFSKLKDGMPVAAAVSATDWGYLRYGVRRELIRIS